MNKSEFITVVAQKSGQPKALTADIINAALEAITETVQKKESISIVGFGTLEVKERKARTRRLIQEGAILEKAMPEVRAMELSDLETYLLQKR